jgi:hypothetical protein
VVHWRDVRHARALGRADAYGPAPSIAIRVVDRSESEINVAWLKPFGATATRTGGAGAWDGRVADLDA